MVMLETVAPKKYEARVDPRLHVNLRFLICKVFVFCLFCFGSSCVVAQSFTIKLQAQTAVQTGFGITFEMALPPMAAWSIGTRATLNWALNAWFDSSLQINALRQIRLLGNGDLYLTAYFGGQIGLYYSPLIEVNDDPIVIPDDDPRVDAPEADAFEENPQPNEDRSPIGTFEPTQMLEFNAFGLGGLDFAYFVNDRFSLYFGLEINAVLLPSWNFKVYPYVEFDYQFSEAFLLVLGGYAAFSWQPSSYFIYLAGFYTLSRGLTLRAELGWNNNFFATLRLAWRF